MSGGADDGYSWGAGPKAAVHDLDEHRPHEVFQAVCPWCLTSWVVVMPVGCRELECGKCGRMSGVPEMKPVMLIKREGVGG